MGIGTAAAAIIGGVTSAAIGAHAAHTAAQEQETAAQQGINAANQNTQLALQAQQAQTAGLGATYQPYMTAGVGAVGQLSQALAPGGSLAQPWTQSFQPPTAQQASQTPGYQFALQQGLNAMQTSAAAKGTLLNPGTMKALNNYAQGAASTTYQQTYNNAFQNYQQNYSQFQQNQLNQYNRLMGLTGVGQTAANAYGQLGQQGATNTANIYNANTNALAQLLGAKGTAAAYGTMGAANAWGGALNNIGNIATNVGLISTLGAQQQKQAQNFANTWGNLNVGSENLGLPTWGNLNVGTGAMAPLSTMGTDLYGTAAENSVAGF
jgi:hypothetical protein